MMEFYLWVKALHVVAVLFWMAALFYLPRLFVYHAAVPPESARAAMLLTMERRLLKIIATPSMLGVWILGLLLLAGSPTIHSAPWFAIKLLLVLLLSAFHGFCAKWHKDFANANNKRSERFYRLANEVPPVVAVFVVLLVILKPFG